MASISRHKQGKWRAIVHRGSVYKSKVFDTKAKAESWARRIETQIDDGEYTDQKLAESTTLGAALDRYLQEVSSKKKDQGRGDKSIAGIISTATSLKNVPLAKIKSADVAKLRDELLKQVSPQTVVRRLALLSHVFTVANGDWGMSNLSNPVMAVRKPSLKGTERDRRLLPGEEARLMKEAHGMLPAIISLALETGMRRGELAALRWNHVNIERKTMHLPAAITKNGEDRDVPLSSRAVAALQSIPRRIDGSVFGMRDISISKAFKRAVDRAGITGLRFHDLRHEATSRFFELSLNPMQVATITGHKTLKMLQRYTHLRAEDLAALLG